MDLDGFFGNAEVGGNLFVQIPGNHELEHVALAFRKRRHALLQRGHLVGDRVGLSTASQRAVHGFQQFLLLDGLGEKVDGSGAHCADRGANVADTRDEYDGQRDVEIG